MLTPAAAEACYSSGAGRRRASRGIVEVPSGMEVSGARSRSRSRNSSSSVAGQESLFMATLDLLSVNII